MASGFFALLDDIATLMDDVAYMSKTTTQKTAGLLADDLAVNAEKASGFVSARELPVIWAITKGSFLNKLIILPIAFLLAAFLPAAITVVLLIGGTYLAFEGVEKIYEYFFHKEEKVDKGLNSPLSKEEMLEYEKKKVKSAIFIDFILSVEIIILALSNVVNEEIILQVIVVSIVSILATVGVYGLVALMVRMDDAGYQLIENSESPKAFKAVLGRFLVNTLPILIKGLTILGTLAMMLVGGGIFVHNLHFVHDWVHALPSVVGELLVGLVVGFLAVFIFQVVKKIIQLIR